MRAAIPCAAPPTTRDRGWSTCAGRWCEIGAVERPEDAWFDDFGNLTWVLMDRDGRHPRRREDGRLLRRPHRHRLAAARPLARGDRRPRPVRRPRGREQAQPRVPARGARLPAARRRVAPPRLGPRRGRPAVGRRQPGGRLQGAHGDEAPRVPARRHRPQLRHRGRGGQRRRQHDARPPPRVAERRPRAHPRRLRPDRGHRLRERRRGRASTAASAAGCRSRWRSPARAATARCPGKAATRSSWARRSSWRPRPATATAWTWASTRSSAAAPARPAGRSSTPRRDCAVPERFTFRFDRRLTAGEDPQAALAAVEGDAQRGGRPRGRLHGGRSGAVLRPAVLEGHQGRQRADLPRLGDARRPPGGPAPRSTRTPPAPPRSWRPPPATARSTRSRAWAAGSSPRTASASRSRPPTPRCPTATARAGCRTAPSRTRR